MDYTINLTITDQSLSASNIVSVNGTVAIIGCAFDFDETWDAFPARQAIFKNSSDIGGYVAAIGPSGCLIPWEVLKKAGTVSMAIVGTNTDGQVQRTNTIMVVRQTRTLQGGVNSIDPTPDQYAQFIADVEEIIGQAGVLSVNGMTGDVTLNASDVGALPDSTVVPSRTSQLTNDSGFLSAIPAEYVTETELNGALAVKANTADLAAVATSGDYDDLADKPTIPTAVSQLTNDAGYQNATQVETAIDNRISSTYKAGGSINFAQLPAPSASVLGMVYDIKDAFTTTAQFVEGAGASYPAGTDVAIVLVSGAYKYDVLGGFVDLSGYATQTDLADGLATKQNTLTAGSGITINGSTISNSGVRSFNGNTGAVVIGNATTSAAGLMSATDKQHLEAVYADYSSAITALGA